MGALITAKPPVRTVSHAYVVHLRISLCEPIWNWVQESARHRSPALIAAKPRVQGMIRDAVLAGLFPEQLLETRLSEAIETATSTCLSALDNDEQAAARLFIQKAAQAADESWQQTVLGQQGPDVAGPTVASLGHPGSASQDVDCDDMDFSAPRKGRLSAPRLQAQLSRLTDRTRLRRLKDTRLSKGAWQQVTRIEDLCHAQVSHT